MALIENIQREDLNALEAAEAYKRLQDEFKLTQEDLAKRVGKERSTVTNFLRLLGLPKEVKQELANGSLSMGHAKALLSLERVRDQIAGRVGHREEGAFGPRGGNACGPAQEPGEREEGRAQSHELKSRRGEAQEGARHQGEHRGQGKGRQDRDRLLFQRRAGQDPGQDLLKQIIRTRMTRRKNGFKEYHSFASYPCKSVSHDFRIHY